MFCTVHLIRCVLMLQVVLILEILIRKCGFDAVNLVAPEKYKEFVRSVEEVRLSSLVFSDLAVEDRSIRFHLWDSLYVVFVALSP